MSSINNIIKENDVSFHDDLELLMVHSTMTDGSSRRPKWIHKRMVWADYVEELRHTRQFTRKLRMTETSFNHLTKSIAGNFLRNNSSSHRGFVGVGIPKTWNPKNRTDRTQIFCLDVHRKNAFDVIESGFHGIPSCGDRVDIVFRKKYVVKANADSEIRKTL